jgi:hypothetical protein
MILALLFRNRCHHRSRHGFPCLRTRVHDYWCGYHNNQCSWHSMSKNRCPR